MKVDVKAKGELHRFVQIKASPQELGQPPMQYLELFVLFGDYPIAGYLLHRP